MLPAALPVSCWGIGSSICSPWPEKIFSGKKLKDWWVLSTTGGGVCGGQVGDTRRPSTSTTERKQ